MNRHSSLKTSVFAREVVAGNEGEKKFPLSVIKIIMLDCISSPFIAVWLFI